MLTKKFNWRTVAMIFACLAVTTMFASCDELFGNDGDDDDDGDGNNNSPIVGMWRSEFSSSGTRSTVGVVFFENDGSYKAIGYYNDIFIGEKGKYKLTGNKLEVYDLLRFGMRDGYLSVSHYVETLQKGYNILRQGTRSEVLAIIDPQHSMWDNYVGATRTWSEDDSWSKEIEWIDNNTIDYDNSLRKPLVRVR